jgi:hypothetical protein
MITITVLLTTVILLKDVLIPLYIVIPDLNVSLILVILKLVVKPKTFTVTIMMPVPRMSAMLKAVAHLLPLNAMMTMPALLIDAIL